MVSGAVIRVNNVGQTVISEGSLEGGLGKLVGGLATVPGQVAEVIQTRMARLHEHLAKTLRDRGITEGRLGRLHLQVLGGLAQFGNIEAAGQALYVGAVERLRGFHEVAIEFLELALLDNLILGDETADDVSVFGIHIGMGGPKKPLDLLGIGILEIVKDGLHTSQTHLGQDTLDIFKARGVIGVSALFL